MKTLILLILTVSPMKSEGGRFKPPKMISNRNIQNSHSNRHNNSQQSPLVLLYTNHKTGTGLARAIARQSPFFKTANIHWAGAMTKPLHQRQDVYVLNLIRDPFHHVLSAYAYHKGDNSKSEPWTNVPLKIKNHRTVGEWQGTNAVVREANLFPTIFDEQNNSKPALSPVFPNESYRDYLRRIPLKQGLLAEIVRSLQRDLPFVLQSYRVTLEHSRAVSVCIEWLSESPSCFQNTLKHVMRDIFKIEDFSSSTVKDPMKRFHAGVSDLDESEKARLLSELHDLDSRLLKGALRQVSNELPCNSTCTSFTG